MDFLYYHFFIFLFKALSWIPHSLLSLSFIKFLKMQVDLFCGDKMLS